MMNKKRATKLISFVLSLVLIATATTYAFADENSDYGTVEEGITSAQSKGTRVYEKPAIDTTTTNPFGFSEGLKYWGPILDSLDTDSSKFTKASDVAGIVKDSETGETYLQVGKSENHKKCGIYTVKVKLPDAADGHKIALFCQTKATGTPNSKSMYGSIQLMKGSSSDSENDVNGLTSTQNIKTTDWSVGDANMITSEAWNKDESSYDCVSVKIQNLYEGDINTVVYVKDIVVAYANDDGSYTSIFDSKVLYNGVTKQPYYGTVKDGIACENAAGAKIFELNAIDATKVNPYSLENGLMYWGASSGLTENAYTKASNVASVVKDDRTGETYLKVGKDGADNKACTVNAVKVKLPNAAKNKKLALFFQIKGEGTPKPINQSANQYGTIKFMYGNSQNTNGFSNVLVNHEQKIKSTDWTVGDTEMVTSEWDGSKYDCVSVEIQNVYEDRNSTVVYIKDIVIAYANDDGSYTSIFDSSVIYNSYTKRPYYGNDMYGMYTEQKANTKIDNMTIATDTLMNGDFSQGLSYWAPRDSQFGYASQYATVLDNVLTLSTKAEYGGVTTCFVKIPDTALNKKVVGLFEYKTGEQYNSSASRVVKLISNAKDAVSEAANDNGQFKLSKTTEYTQGCTKYMQFPTSGSTVRLEIHNGYCPASMKNVALAYMDEIGIADKELYANLDGTPYGYEMGDANATGTVDVGDLVRMKRYMENTNCGIYYTAAHMSRSGDSVSITEADVRMLINTLLEKVEK